jgi:RNA polymerase sigma-70 factor (ECF subfamily)
MGDPSALENEIRAHCEAQRWVDAATLLVRGYGPELYAFLATALGGEEVATADTFSDLTEALWRQLPGFAWESSARTWAYAIAHKLTLMRRRDAARRRRRVVDARASEVERVAAHIRTETASFLQTEKKTRLQAMRDSLPEADRLLLLLRVDRGLSWNEIARILAGESELEDAALAKEAARHRKRYQLVKDRLRELARREGLLR